MRSADARLSASTMTSSSIRLSLVGAQVDCTTKTSRVRTRSEEHTSELQSPCNLVCRLLLEKKKKRVEPIAPQHPLALRARYTQLSARPSFLSSEFPWSVLPFHLRRFIHLGSVCLPLPSTTC